MTEDSEETGTDGEEIGSLSDGWQLSRRRLLEVGAGTGALAGIGSLAHGSEQETYQFDQQTETETGTPTSFAGFFEQGTEVGAQKVAGGPLTAPTDFADPGGQSGRFFVTDQTGEVWVVTEDGVRDEPLINVSDRMVELGQFYGLYASQDQDYDERGLLGIALHPKFNENGRLFLHYSAPPTEELRAINWDHIEVVSEFKVEDGTANPESEKPLLEIPSPQYNHDSGPMTFGPDGLLYVPMGDGGGANDEMYGHVPDWYQVNVGGNGQDVRHNLMGDILRIDVDGGTGAEDTTSDGTPTGTPTGDQTETPEGGDEGVQDTIKIDRPYGIPEDNPFVGNSDALDEIYAYGFRNPFGIDFDSQGNLFVADAGQNLWEEVDVVVKGGNYGWNVKEGTHCFSTENPGAAGALEDCPESEPTRGPYNGSPLIDPIAEYPHFFQGESVGIVVVGGHRYENDTIPDLQGKYVFGDWSADPARQKPRGRVFTATPPEGWESLQVGTPAEEEDEDVETAGGTPEDETPADGADTETAVTETVPEKETPGEEEEQTPRAEVGPEDVPRDQLWDMAQLQFVGDFNWFVRQFGQDQDGEIYILVSKKGIPEGETGAVLKVVPPEEAEAQAGTETPAEETPEEGTPEGGDTPQETPVEGTPTETEF